MGDHTAAQNVLNLRVNEALRKYRPLGGWIEQPADLQPPLQGDVSGDVVIVGAGFAGLCTALELAARGAQVVLLERNFAGFGASGRNAGYLAGGQGLRYDAMVDRLGEAQARQVVRFYEDGVDPDPIKGGKIVIQAKR
jgi:NADPH-dependent 2,4-dienoyl-CoA reductase/sulfur reductase-like enzyme